MDCAFKAEETNTGHRVQSREATVGQWTNSECLTGNLLDESARTSLHIERSSLERR